MLIIRQIKRAPAFAYVAAHHRHNKAPQGDKFRCACYDGDRLCGVGIAGRPVARALDDGETLEITRVCTDGTRNACTALYGALLRAAKALGFRRVLTYVLASETGTSAKAAGLRHLWSVAGGRQRSCRSAPRAHDPIYEEAKIAWGWGDWPTPNTAPDGAKEKANE